MTTNEHGKTVKMVVFDIKQRYKLVSKPDILVKTLGPISRAMTLMTKLRN